MCACLYCVQNVAARYMYKTIDKYIDTKTKNLTKYLIETYVYYQIH